MAEFETPTPQITVGNITEADLREAMMGTPMTPTYAEQFGMTSAPLGSTGQSFPSPAQLELDAEKALERAKADAVQAREANRQPDPFATPDELEHWKKLYGDSENEKGSLRKNYTELLEAFNGLMAQQQEMNTQPPQQWQQAPQPPPQPFGPMGGFPRYAQDPFENIADDDVLQGKTLKQFTDRVLLPAFYNLQQESQAAQARAAALEVQVMRQAKINAGITPMEELRLLGKNPWLKSLPEANRLHALAGLRQAEIASRPAAPQAQPAAPQTTETQRRILEKVTYVEGSKPDVPDSSEAAIEAAKMRDYAKVMSAPMETGERAKLFRVFAQKYNITGLASPPSDLAH